MTSPGCFVCPGGRERLGLPGDVGPQMVVTDRGILKFDEKTKRMYLAGYYPTSSPEDVLENTGFDLDVSRAVELEAPDPEVIKRAVRDYKTAPAGYSLDFGVTDTDKTLLIEVNDGYALGSYGLFYVDYAKLLAARWAELTETKDEYEDF